LGKFVTNPFGGGDGKEPPSAQSHPYGEALKGLVGRGDKEEGKGTLQRGKERRD